MDLYSLGWICVNFGGFVCILLDLYLFCRILQVVAVVLLRLRPSPLARRVLRGTSLPPWVGTFNARLIWVLRGTSSPRCCCCCCYCHWFSCLRASEYLCECTYAHSCEYSRVHFCGYSCYLWTLLWVSALMRIPVGAPARTPVGIS